ncbi:MAG: hypothetical protein KDA20_01880 [Phycisphaerales bacterium]|nr:hypothetical protein [Phycisphaerales bacterium]
MSDQTGDRWDPTREDILIGRVTDGEASPADWGELEQLAKDDAHLWVRLAQAQRAHARVTRVVDEQVSIAELVELPDAPTYHLPFWQRAVRFGGWAAAAVLAIAWGVDAPGERASLIPDLKVTSPTAEQAYADYMNAGLAEGRVLGELTPQVIEAQPIEGGDGYETVFVRRIVERSHVTGAVELRVTVNDAGLQNVVRRPAAMELLLRGTQAPAQDPSKAKPAAGGAI